MSCAARLRLGVLSVSNCLVSAVSCEGSAAVIKPSVTYSCGELNVKSLEQQCLGHVKNNSYVMAVVVLDTAVAAEGTIKPTAVPR